MGKGHAPSGDYGKTTVETTAWASQSRPRLPEVSKFRRGAGTPLKLRNPFSKKPSRAVGRALNWVQGLDLNQRPSGYEPDELPGCSTLQQVRRANSAGQVGTVNGFSKRKVRRPLFSPFRSQPQARRMEKALVRLTTPPRSIPASAPPTLEPAPPIAARVAHQSAPLRRTNAAPGSPRERSFDHTKARPLR